MPEMLGDPLAAERAAHLRGVAEYYEQTQVDYDLVWRARNAGALHYGWWDETTSTLAQALKRENVVLADMANVQPGDRVLDAGCGIGGSSVYMAAARGAVVDGITVSHSQALNATRRAERFGVSDRARFSLQDFTRTAFKPGSFDVVWALESVGHTPNKDFFIDEAWRVLRPGGALLWLMVGLLLLKLTMRLR